MEESQIRTNPCKVGVAVVTVVPVSGGLFYIHVRQHRLRPTPTQPASQPGSLAATNRQPTYDCNLMVRLFWR